MVALPVVYLAWLNKTVSDQNEKQNQMWSRVAARQAASRTTPSPDIDALVTAGFLTAQPPTATMPPPPPPPPTWTPSPPAEMTPTAPAYPAPDDHYESVEVQPVYWWINAIPPAPGRYRGTVSSNFTDTYAKISYYYPPLAYIAPKFSINCDTLDDGRLECEMLGNGELVRENVGLAAACPADIPPGSVIEITGTGQRWICKDRGGAIVRVSENLFWVDLLYPYMPIGVNWGTSVHVRVYAP